MTLTETAGNVTVHRQRSARGEAILRSPLAPAPYIPEFPIPEVLNEWTDGSIRVVVLHSWSQYCVSAKESCNGRIVVPIPKGATGNRDRFCDSCGEQVTVRSVGAIPMDIRAHREAMKDQASLEKL